MDNKYYLVALNHIPQVGPRTILKLLTRWPRLEALFQLSASAMERAGLPPWLAAAIAHYDHGRLDKDWRWQEKAGHALLTWADPGYPPLLREIHDPPPVLYAIGDVANLQEPAVAIVGSRKPSVTGSETAWRLAYELASHSVRVVSGLALGIDAQAHRGCLAAGGKTVAVMATGMDHIYPRRHVALAAQIKEQGVLLSEFPLQVSPVARHFPRRNRIISGLTLCTLVVEATIKSGSLITARLALEQNRDVLAVPGSIYSPQSTGCHYLLQQGAKLVSSSADVLAELGLGGAGYVPHVSIPKLATENENLVKCIGFEITTVDQMVERSGLNVAEVVRDLAKLEIQGVVKAVPGGYMRCAI